MNVEKIEEIGSKYHICQVYDIAADLGLIICCCRLGEKLCLNSKPVAGIALLGIGMGIVGKLGVDLGNLISDIAIK